MVKRNGAMREQEQTYATYADALEKRFSAGVLSELQPYPQFVVWKAVQVGEKIKKLPFSPITNQVASPTNPETWGSLANALVSLRTGNYNGIGFVFSANDPFTGIDIDHCVITGTLTDQATNLIQQLDSYTEYSPSRTGIHILVQGTIPEGRRKNEIEMYSAGRYFTVTTNHVKGSPATIEQRQPQLSLLYASLTTNKARREVFKPQEYQLYVSDEAVLEKAKKARNGQSFTDLYEGNIAGFKSKSEADFTLILRLLFWTNDDIAQVRRLFLQSQLFDEKTLRPTKDSTYLDETIANALKKRQKK
jgi:putative DNA primase/helicase